MSLLALEGERERSISVTTNGGAQEAFNRSDSPPHTHSHMHSHTCRKLEKRLTIQKETER